jgi:hypothetical protein
VTFAGTTGTLKIDTSADFTGTIGGQIASGNLIDLVDITAGANATVACHHSLIVCPAPTSRSSRQTHSDPVTRPCAFHRGSIDVALLAERSAARLAHQSGGLGVPGSNPGAPTNIAYEIGA